MLRGALAIFLCACFSAEARAVILPNGDVALTPAANTQKMVARRRKRRSRRRRTRRPVKKAEPKPAAAEPQEPTSPPPLGRPGGPTRVEFEGMQIKGQTTKAGEVQVLERRDTELKSMVKRRTSFRQEIIHTVFPDFREERPGLR